MDGSLWPGSFGECPKQGNSLAELGEVGYSRLCGPEKERR